MSSHQGEMPPREIFNLVADGARHTIVKTGGSGSLGITLPKDELKKRGLGPGDDVVIIPGDSPNTFELHLPPEDA